VTQLSPAETAGRRAEALLALSQDLGDAMTPAQVAQIVTSHLREVSGVYYAAIALLDGRREQLQFVTLDGMPDTVRQEWADVSLDVRSPLTDAVRTRRAIFHASRGALLAEHPALAGSVDAVSINAYASLPLITSGRVIGALSMSWQQPRPFSAEDRSFLVTVAGLGAQAVERAGLFEDLNRQIDRISRLQQATADLAAAHTRDEVLAAVLDPAKALLGAGSASIGLMDRPRGQLVFHDLASGRMQIPPKLYRFPLDTSSPSTHAVVSGRPQTVASREELHARYPASTIDEFLSETTEHSWACVPLVGSSGVTGVLRVAWNHPRPATEPSLAFLSSLAGQCAQALERIELRAAEHEAVVRLTTTLLPERLPEVEGLNLAARLLAAPHGNAPAGSRLGGDWWDALPLSGGRIALVVGDVMGKGLQAAAVAGRVRNALRLALVREPDPARAFAAVEQLLLLTEPDDQIVTAGVAVLDLVARSVTLASAGHPPPLIRTGDEVSLLPVPAGTPLGLPAERELLQLRLPPGEQTTLLLYSDGLVENRARSLSDGFAALLDATGRVPAAGPLDGWIDALLAAVLPDGQQDDDVTLLAVRTC